MSLDAEPFALRFLGSWKNRAACSLAVGLLACWLLFGVMLGINIRDVFEYFIPLCAVPALLVVALFYEIFTNALELARSLPEQARKDGLENKAAFWGVVVYTVLWFLPPSLLLFAGNIFFNRSMSFYRSFSFGFLMLFIFAIVFVIMVIPLMGLYFIESLYRKKFGVSLGFDIKIKRDGKKLNIYKLTFDISEPEPLPGGSPFVLIAMNNGGGRLLVVVLMAILFLCLISYFDAIFAPGFVIPLTVTVYKILKYLFLPAMKRNAGRAYFVMLFFAVCCVYCGLPLIFMGRMMELSVGTSRGVWGVSIFWGYFIYIKVFCEWANRSFKILFGDPIGLRYIDHRVNTFA